LKHEQAIAKFLPSWNAVSSAGKVVSVTLKLRASPGHDTVLGKEIPERPMYLDAPVAVTVFSKKRKSRRRQALCMSFYVLRNTISFSLRA
jgi:hypothetical protein